MVTREIRTSLDSDLYIELMSAMMENREYDGCYVMQYSERQEQEGMVAVFMLRDARQPSEESE